MPILIRETTIRADLSDNADATSKNDRTHPIPPLEPVADLEGQVQKLLLRKLKARDER